MPSSDSTPESSTKQSSTSTRYREIYHTPMRLSTDKFFFLSLFIFSLLFLSATARPFVLVLSQDDLTDAAPSAADDDGASSSTSDWDEFGDSDTKREEELDPGRGDRSSSLTPNWLIRRPTMRRCTTPA
ncbi:ERAD-associated E3 ubiquitin-protein ligase component HRD3A [Camellia lanceoleosa]|uniref:ERAD-associated E3 ubiquitin-protein ligase component HRD3A n=1 Tax=Camellia lanceoleosa TaxID=1840588 RepID=A0ACC0FCJ6_9ERIC|nr:ERAD-associated E3 ubiquitin-protein ligase component HRD3A [Camellia lanceoleosa]